MLTQVGSVRAGALLPAIALFAVLSTVSTAADAQRVQRQGKEVVDAVCGGCHVPGKDGAPRIGDTAAWAPRASQGLTALTSHAITGIRKMPAHGGSPGVSDVEIQRAIVYMVNLSGGNWVEPLSASTPHGTWESAMIGLNAGSQDFPFVTKLANSKDFPDRVFTIGAKGVYVSQSFGARWNLTPIPEKFIIGTGFYLDVEVSRADANIVWAGSGMTEGGPSERFLHVSKDGGMTFQPTKKSP